MESNGENKPSQPPNTGGFGGNLSPATSVRDARLMHKAVRKRWNIPETVYEQLPAAMTEMALNPDASERARVSAAKVVTVMHGQNEQADTPETESGVNVNVSLNLLELPADERGRRLAAIASRVGTGDISALAPVAGPPRDSACTRCLADREGDLRG